MVAARTGTVDALCADLLALAGEVRAALDGENLEATLTGLERLTARGRAITEPAAPPVSATARAAMAYMDANAACPSATVAAVAAAVAVTPRALQAAFRRHLGTTPSAYLRAARLDRARAELAAAVPGQVTVGCVAARWGYANADRFTAAYRAAYGETPSATLRRPAGPASTATTPSAAPA